MMILKKASDLSKYIGKMKAEGFTIGFVPTMGALHKGHISLIDASRNQCGITACSIFVNPTQFNDQQDFEKYPSTLDQDICLLEESGCDILFIPTVHEIYPTGTDLLKQYDLGPIESILEGKYRPGHFQGVCQVVHRLLEITTPDLLFLGQKDFQQCMVIKKMMEISGFDTIRVNICPTLREKNGLAMSSRNMRLSDDGKEMAGIIFTALDSVKKELSPGNIRPLKEKAITTLQVSGFRVDYFEIAETEGLAICDDWDGRKKLVAITAAFLEEVRLIDNLLLN
ncbi:MAG: pantoate--beta-alanine ligase [Terrimonas sp.]|nr:pantoate--beta-alanine ligase [Terrimonas sp.]